MESLASRSSHLKRTQLDRTIAKALKVTKFDSVSTLLTDYMTQKAGFDVAECGPNVACPTDVKGVKKASSPLIGSAGVPRASSPTIGGHEEHEEHEEHGPQDQPGAKAWNNLIGSAKSGPRSNELQLPTGKLEEDREASLFASRTRHGRRMVSVMTAGRKRRRGAPCFRRARTADARTGTGERGIAQRGLGIRDMTPPGFSPPVTDEPPFEGDGTATAESQGVPSSSGEQDAPEEGGAKAGALENGIPAVGRVGEDNRVGGSTQKRQGREMCFNCWSKGNAKMCRLHGGSVGSSGGGKKGEEVQASESALMCKNWDVGVMQRRYRAEELQVNERTP